MLKCWINEVVAQRNLVFCMQVKKVAMFASVLLLSGCVRLHEEVEKEKPEKYRAVIIQAAGYLPGGKKPDGVDAVTHATTKAINTYTLTKVLERELGALNVNVKVVQYTDCMDLQCLCSVAEKGEVKSVDLVVFAGPSYFSKQPKQILALFKKLKNVVKESPDIVCSSLVPAWYPETKGKKAVEYSDGLFKSMNAHTVLGVSLLTPRKKLPGVSPAEAEKVLRKFAGELMLQVSKSATR